MKKIVVQFVFLLLMFGSIWFAVSQVSWAEIFKVKEVSESTEEKLGELYKDFFTTGHEKIEEKQVLNAIDSILKKICEHNFIDCGKIKVHVLNTSEINAFALPDNHMVIFSGLINECESAEEFAGVLAHEMAHMELNHVTKKLVKEVGLGLLVAATANGGGEIIKETARTLSSTAYDRKLEKEADFKAVEYLSNAKIDAEPFAGFLYRLSTTEPDVMENLSWISTHPHAEERAKYILQEVQWQQKDFKPLMDDDKWETLKESLE